jgi:hypothetical protein
MLIHISDKLVQILIKNIRTFNRVKKNTTYIFSHKEDYTEQFNKFIKYINSLLTNSIPTKFLINIKIIINSNSNSAINLFYKLDAAIEKRIL